MTIEDDIEALDQELAAQRLEVARLLAKIEGLQAERDALAALVSKKSTVVVDNGASASDLRRLTRGQAIVEVLRRSSPEPMRVRGIVDALAAAGRNANYNGVSVDLQVLLAQDQVRRVERGLYTTT